MAAIAISTNDRAASGARVEPSIARRRLVTLSMITCMCWAPGRRVTPRSEEVSDRFPDGLPDRFHGCRQPGRAAHERHALVRDRQGLDRHVVLLGVELRSHVLHRKA